MNKKANGPDRSRHQPWPVQNGPRSALVGRISLGVLATLAIVFLAVFWQTVISILIGVAGAVVGVIVFLYGDSSDKTQNKHEDGWRDGPRGFGYYVGDSWVLDGDGNDTSEI